SMLNYSKAAATEEQTLQAPPQEFNTEEYGKIVERGFTSPLSEPLSTFSIDVDTASYANMRRLVMNHEQVPQDAVRIEEMINYFQYDYPEPRGDVPFAVYTEMASCPWNQENQLLLIGLKGKEIQTQEIPPSNLVFLLDVSGSMEDSNKLPLVKEAFVKLVENLRTYDRISIVTYAGSESIVLEGATGEDKLKITDALNNLQAGGSTAGARGIETAYELSQKYFLKDGNNRVILATDGDFNVGVSSEGELKRLIEQKRDQEIYLSVLGFGYGNIKDNKMETLADNGNGNYAYIDSVLEAKKVLVEEMGGTLFTIAKDVKLQVEFNPEKVKGYRLVGYENRMLNTEDFNDDTKDAGEMGAGHRVTALYEIIPSGSAQEVDQSNLKYQKIESTGSSEWMTIHVRYKEPDENTSKPLSFAVSKNEETSSTSEDFAFASSVAEFGLILRDSEFKGNASLEGVYKRIVNLPSVQQDVYKAEFLNIVKRLME
ncbi:MAG: VWA domain-containing protein, partial [Clostridia bacterium]|nr:VWA domain-containing protein [Clostridia bacterium]